MITYSAKTLNLLNKLCSDESNWSWKKYTKKMKEIYNSIYADNNKKKEVKK